MAVWSTCTCPTAEPMYSAAIDLFSARTWMTGTEWQSQPKAHSNAYWVVIKPQAKCRYRYSLKPIACMRSWHGNQPCSVDLVFGRYLQSRPAFIHHYPVPAFLLGCLFTGRRIGICEIWPGIHATQNCSISCQKRVIAENGVLEIARGCSRSGQLVVWLRFRSVDRRVAGSIPDSTNFLTNSSGQAILTLWCPCSPSSKIGTSYS